MHVPQNIEGLYKLSFMRRRVEGAAVERRSRKNGTGSYLQPVSDMIAQGQVRRQHHPYGETCITMNTAMANTLLMVSFNKK